MSVGEYVDKCVKEGNYETISDDGYITVTLGGYHPNETIAEYMDRMVAKGTYDQHEGELISVPIPK